MQCQYNGNAKCKQKNSKIYKIQTQQQSIVGVNSDQLVTYYTKIYLSKSSERKISERIHIYLYNLQNQLNQLFSFTTASPAAILVDNFITQSVRLQFGVKRVPYIEDRTKQSPSWRGKRQRQGEGCLLYTSPSPRDGLLSRMPSSA